MGVIRHTIYDLKSSKKKTKPIINATSKINVVYLGPTEKLKEV